MTAGKLVSMEKDILEFRSVKEIEDHTTLKSDMNTEDLSFKQLSFNSEMSKEYPIIKFNP